MRGAGVGLKDGTGRVPRALRVGALLVTVAWACRPPEAAPPASSFLIAHARIVDGSGGPAYEGAVRVEGGRIVAVGGVTPLPGEPVVDARGATLAPGFIDTHSHHDRGLFDRSDAPAVVSQGVTTVVVGQDGGSPFPLASFLRRLEQEPVAVNVAAYSGHNTLRASVMGEDFRRPARDDEVGRMAEALQADLDAGALGLSSGLEYDPGIYATGEEVMALARVAAGAGGRYMSHLRSEDRQLWSAVEEALSIGAETGIPVQISHMKLAMRSLWGQADRLLSRLDSARIAGVDVTADVYPYEYWQSTMTVLFPERDFADRAAAEFALRELVSPEGMRIGRFDPDPSYVGLTLAEIAAIRRRDPVTVYLELIAESQAMARETGRGAESIIATSMADADVRTLLAWPHTNISSDGALEGRHPRGFGSFPRVLGRYVGPEGIPSLEEAVHKMTALAARHVGLEGRGRIEEGAAADLVLFDPERVLDRATPDDPWLESVGILTVWVNGEVVYREGEGTTGSRPGRPLRRSVP